MRCGFRSSRCRSAFRPNAREPIIGCHLIIAWRPSDISRLLDGIYPRTRRCAASKRAATIGVMSHRQRLGNWQTRRIQRSEHSRVNDCRYERQSRTARYADEHWISLRHLAGRSGPSGATLLDSYAMGFDRPSGAGTVYASWAFEKFTAKPSDFAERHL